MTIYISPFVMGIICTIGAEFLVLMLYAIVHSLKTHRNTSNSSRSDKNE